MYLKLRIGEVAGYFKLAENSFEKIDADDEQIKGLFGETTYSQLIADETIIREGLKESIVWEPIPVPLPGDKHVFLYPGLGVIFGTAASGKTVLANHMMKMLSDGTDTSQIAHISYNEPDLFPESSVMTLVDEMDLMSAIVAFFMSKAKVLIIDSIRSAIYSSKGGATGKGGIDMTMYTKLTHLSIVAKQFGKSINVLFNPISADGAVVDNVAEAVKGSVETCYYINMDNRTLETETRFHATKRVPVTIPYSPKALTDSYDVVDTAPEKVYEYADALTDGVAGPLADLLSNQLKRTAKTML